MARNICQHKIVKNLAKELIHGKSYHYIPKKLSHSKHDTTTGFMQNN